MWPKPTKWLGGLLLGLLLASVVASAWSATTKPAAHPKVVAAKSKAVHSAAKTTPPLVPFIQTLTKGMKGCPCPTVFQMQRALKAAHVRPKSSKSTGYFGEITYQQVRAFQKSVHIKTVTGRYGTLTHHYLSKYYDSTGRARLIQVQKGRKLQALYSAITTVTQHAQNVGGNTLTYSQSASTRSILPKYPGIPPATDCSGYVTWVYQSVGLPDPSGWSFHPAGWTGSISLHGLVVSAYTARIGDLVFYGGGRPFGHVAIVTRLHPTRVSTHGHTGIQLEPITYRPVSQVRRYF